MWWHRAACGLIIGIAYALGEGAGVALLARDGSVSSIAVSLGVLAPVAISCGALWAIGTWGFERWLGEAYADRITDWAVRGEPDERAGRTGWLLATLAAVGMWMLAGVAVGPALMEDIATPLFAAAALLIVLIVIAALIAALVPAAAALAARAVGLIASHRFVTPLGLLAAILGGLMIAIAGSWILLPETMILMPWGYPLGAIAALVAWIGCRVRPAIMKPRATAAVLGVLSIVTFFAPRATADAFAPVRDSNSISALVLSAATAALDFDADEALSFYGGLDCEPFDSSIGPNSVEIVANGIDEDCSGSDLVVDTTVDEPLPRGPRPPGLSKRPHIFMVTADALTHTHTTVGGYERDTTPGLAKLAADATVFDHAFSLSASTRTALPGLLSGTFNAQVRMRSGRRHPFQWEKDWPTMATILKERGYETRHVFSDKYFRKRWYTNGYDHVVDGYGRAANKNHTAKEVADAAIEQIAARGDKPLHMWVHFYDAHHPYQQPEGVKKFGKRKVDRYDAELIHLDKHWTRVFEYIQKTFKPDEYILIVSSDHGEAFDDNHLVGEHHTGSVLTAVTHVPLIIQAPFGRGKRYEQLVTHADVLPTIAHVVDAKEKDFWIGSSLLGLMTGSPFGRDRIYSLRYEPRRRKNRTGFLDIGVRTAQRHLMLDVRAGTAVMVDWKNDLLERNDLSDKEPDTYAQLRYLAARRLEWLREHENGIPK